MFYDFLQKYCVEIGQISEEEIHQDQKFLEISVLFQWTDFKASDDTFLYSQLLSKVFKLLSPLEMTSLIDLGAGSCIPSIIALLANPHHENLKITAVDNNPETILTSKSNILKAKLLQNYTLVQQDLLDFLRDLQYCPTQIIASNPPYLPVPANTTEENYRSVNGGPDGTKYLHSLLLAPLPAGTILVLEWSSLSNPSLILPLIEKHYEVIFVQASRTPFGTYTGSYILQPYLEFQREQGKSVFFTDQNGQHHFIIVGCILRKKITL